MCVVSGPADSPSHGNSVMPGRKGPRQPHQSLLGYMNTSLPSPMTWSECPFSFCAPYPHSTISLSQDPIEKGQWVLGKLEGCK